MPTSAATSLVRLNTDELHQLKWLLGQFQALMAMWALFGLEMGSEPLLLIITLGVMSTLFFPKLPGRVPAFFWKAANPTLIAIIVVDFALHGVEFLKPMVRMIMLLTLVRSLQYRKSREDLQLVLLCLFTLVVKGVLTVSLLFAFQMLLFTPAAMALLFLINLLETTRDRSLTVEDWNRFSWIRFLNRLAKGLDFRLLGFAGMLFVGLVSVSSLIFVLMPRFSMDQAFPFLQMEGSGKVGFSDRIRFGDVNELSNDETMALRVTVPNLNSLPTRPFWRMVILDSYYDGVFEVSSSLKQKSRSMMEGSRYPDTAYGRLRQQSDDDWIFFLEGDVSQYLPLIGSYESIIFSQKTKFWPYTETGVIELDRVPSSVFGYRIIGATPTDRFPANRNERLHLDNAEGPIRTDERSLEYPLTTLEVPNSDKAIEYLSSVKDEIIAGESVTKAEYVQRVQEWLQKNYQYDMRHKPLSEVQADPLILWMQESDRGWCEHFTGAFVLLCRMNGIPARAVAGFAGGFWNNYEDYLAVYNSNAHAWAEVYLDGQWIRYDPTPPSVGGVFSNAALATNIGAISGWTAWVDSLRMMWYRRVVNFDQADQMEMATGLKDFSVSAYEEFKKDVQAAWLRFKVWLLSGWDREKTIRVLLWVAGVCFVLAGLRYLWKMVKEAAGKGGVWSHLFGGDPTRRQAGKLLNKIRPHWQKKQEQTGKDLTRWKMAVDGLQRIRFGPLEERPDHKEIFKEARHLIRRGPEKA